MTQRNLHLAGEIQSDAEQFTFTRLRNIITSDTDFNLDMKTIVIVEAGLMKIVAVLAQKQTDKIAFASKVIHYLNSCTKRMSLESNGEKKQ